MSGAVTEIDAGLAGMATSAKAMLAKLDAMQQALGTGEQLSIADALATIAVCHDALKAALGLTRSFQEREVLTRLQGQHTLTAIGLALAATGKPN